MPETLGGGLQSLSAAMPQFLGGATGTLGSMASGAGNWLAGSAPAAGGMAGTGLDIPANLGAGTTGLDGSTGDGTTAVGPYAPTPSLAPPATAAGSSIAGTPPFPGPPSPVAANWYTDPANTGTGTPGGVPGTQFTDPAADGTPWWQKAIQAITGKPAGQGGLGASILTAGNLAEAIQRWQMQRRLQDPSQVLAQSQKLAGGLSKGLKRSVGAATGQEMAAAGLAGAPGLYSQAVATALAPYRYQQQQDALKEYLASMQEAMAEYPGSGGLFGPGGYGSYPGEDKSSSASS